MFHGVVNRLSRMAAVTAVAGQMVAQQLQRFAAQKLEITGAMRRHLQRKATKRARQVTSWSPNGTRECQRRVRQGAHERQIASHGQEHYQAPRFGMVRPSHIFGFPQLYDTCCTCCVEPWVSKQFRQAGGVFVVACRNCHSIREFPGPKEGAVA